MTLAIVRPDGRNLRAVKTRAAIIAAHRTLLELRELGPTTSRIAEVAGISPRTLFVHFADLETLFAATADDLVGDVLARHRPADPELPLDLRVDAFVANRLGLYSFLEPYVLALRMREPNSRVLRERRRLLMAASREEISVTFASELARSDDPEDALLSLETAISWPAWFHLHQELALDRADIHRILRRSLLRLVAA
ncbi:MAG: hypothetical protein JWN31_1868 [Frankiales bacterium]|nr:hypothetical protein [Frankiales bacterium]